MATITGVKALIRNISVLIKYVIGNLANAGESSDIIPSPIAHFTDFILDYPVVFIFVVAVPLVGLGIGLLRRMLSY